MRISKSILVAAIVFGVCSAPSEGAAQTAEAGVTRICSARAAAAQLAQSLATKIKTAVDAGAAAAKRSPASVRVTFSPPKTRPAVTKVDFAKDVKFTVNLAAATDKITFQGPPDVTSLYQTCDAGRMTFTISIAYRDLSKTPNVPVAVRQTVELALPGQYL